LTVKSPGTFRDYAFSLDPYSLYQKDVLGKIMFTTSFDHSTNFSNAFDKFKRALTITPAFTIGCSYLHSSNLHAQVFDKLLRALTASELVAWTLR